MNDRHAQTDGTAKQVRDISKVQQHRICTQTLLCAFADRTPLPTESASPGSGRHDLQPRDGGTPEPDLAQTAR